MEPDRVNILARTVLCNLQKIDNAEEAGFSCQLRRDIREPDRLNGIHFDFAFFHPVSPAGYDMRGFPDSNAALADHRARLVRPYFFPSLDGGTIPRIRIYVAMFP